MRTFIFLLSIAPLCAQFELRSPAFGCHAGANGQLRLFQGVRASLVALPLLAEGARAGLCNSQFVLYQSEGEVVLSAGGITYAMSLAESAQLALGEGVAVVISPANGEIRYWQDGSWRLSPALIDGSVSAVRVVGGKATILSAERVITIGLVSGAIEHNSPAPRHGPVVSLLADGSILTVVDERWIHCVGSECSDVGRAPGGVVSLTPLNEEWLAASTESGTVLAVRVKQRQVESFFLPGSAQE